MNNNEHSVKKRLIELGAVRLADELIESACSSPVIKEFIERLTVSKEENIQRYKKKLKGLRNRISFIEYEDTEDYEQDLCSLLDTLESASPAPETGLDLIEQFFEADCDLIECCDDFCSIESIFKVDAANLFIDYASRCTDKQKVTDTIIRLSLQDELEVRRCLIDFAEEMVSEDSLRTMIETLERTCQKYDEGSYQRSHILSLIQSLAHQLQDIPLYEETVKRKSGSIPVKESVIIARLYFEQGDADRALARLKSIADDGFVNSERDELLLEIQTKLGNTEASADILLKKFRSYRSLDALNTVLDLIGRDKEKEIMQTELDLIMNDPTFCEINAVFLIQAGELDQAEQYILQRADLLCCSFYETLLPIAETMTGAKKFLAATHIYRSLLEDILTSGRSKAYHHAVDYLAELDRIAPLVPEWKRFPDHSAYHAALLQEHGRKRSFWSQYQLPGEKER